jgi:uncharacterized protein YceK
MRRLLMLNVMALLSGCATVDSRPCPRTTEFPRDLMMQAADELVTAPALSRMMDAMGADRAYNRAICS